MKKQLKESILNEVRANPKLAMNLIIDRGVKVSKDIDFHELSSSDVDKILDAAKEYKYKKPRNANGSKARMFYQFAKKGL